MGLRTSDDYLDSLKDGREVYYDGELVQDIVGHPVLGQSLRHFARVFALQADPKFRELATVEEDGERVSRFFTPPRSGEELQQLAQLVEAFAIEAQGADFHLAKFTAVNALLALMMVGKRIDQEHGTQYGERAEAILAACRRQDLTGALCMSDTKGDRTQKPHDQADPALYTRMVERRPDGVMIRGAKTSVTGSPFVDEQRVAGVAVPNNLIANAGKYHATSGHHRAIELVQDIAGGGLGDVPERGGFDEPGDRAAGAKIFCWQRRCVSRRAPADVQFYPRFNRLGLRR